MNEVTAEDKNEATLAEERKRRLYTHIGFSVLLFLVIIGFRAFAADRAVINSIFKIAGYTYGPLLGLFAFGLFTRLRVREVTLLGNTKIPALLLVCLAAPIFSMVIDTYSAEWFFGFEFGFLILAFNGLLTFLGLVALSDFGDFEPVEE